MAAERMNGGFAASEMIYRMSSSVANNITFMAAAANTGSIDGSRGNAAAQPTDDSTDPQPENGITQPADDGTESQPENIVTQPTDDGTQSTDATNSTVDGTGLQITSQELQANDIAPQADDVQKNETWTAENTVLSWSSVEYADAYYFTLTDVDGAADGSGNAMTAEFKIVEKKDETDPSATTVTVFGKDAAGSNQWEEIAEIAEPDLSAGIDIDLSQDGATFQTYHKVVSGMYAVDSSTTIPYEVDLKTILNITMQDGVFTYTLSLPDSNSLNPPADSAYALEGNSIVNSNSDKLRFTDSVRIWSDMSVNDDADQANWSEAYVKSVEYVAEFNN